MSERKYKAEAINIYGWTLYGQGPGLKTKGLLAFHALSPRNVQVRTGISLGASFFDDFKRQNGIPDTATEDDFNLAQFPESLTTVNKQIVTALSSGQPYAVRSSGLEEKGGGGVFRTKFFVPTGDPDIDLACLEESEREVYQSYYSPRAQLNRSPKDPHGMGVLIHPVVGDQYGDHFMPIISGVYSQEDGRTLMNIAIGLGTKVVTIDEAVSIDKQDFQGGKIFKKLRQLMNAHAIHLATGRVENIPVTEDMITAAFYESEKLRLLMEEADKLNEQGNPHYLEFAVDRTNNPAYIVQASQETAPKPVKVEFEKLEGTLLCEGKDVVNTGIKNGKGIIMIGNRTFDPNDLALMERLNRENKGYLVIFPDHVFSGFAGDDPLLDFKHFSNAAGVIEQEYVRDPAEMEMLRMMGRGTVEHTKGYGATHFAQLCKRKDILFLGTVVQPGNNMIVKKLGTHTEQIGQASSYWDVDYKMENIKGQGRVVLLGKPKQREFSKKDLQAWASEFYKAVKFPSDMDSGDDSASSFADVMDCLITGSRGSLNDFNPFRAVEETDKKDLPNLLKSIQKVIQEGPFYLPSYEEPNYYPQYEEDSSEPQEEPNQIPLDKYLKTLQAKVEERIRNEQKNL